MKSKKSTDCFLLMQRYVDNDLDKSIECLNGIVKTAVSGKNKFSFSSFHLLHFSFSLSDKVVSFFELFYNNNVISAEAFKAWCKPEEMSKEKKSRALYLARSFFMMLDETDKKAK